VPPPRSDPTPAAPGASRSAPERAPTRTPAPTPTPTPSPSALPCTGLGGHVLCVDIASAAPNELGTADAPFRSLARAIALAPDGATVQVAAGLYRENIVVDQRTLTLLGGFAAGGDFARRDPGSVTTLEGDGTSAVVTLLEAGDSIVDGFRIIGGRGRPGDRREGGGIYADGGRVTLSHNLIEDNDAGSGEDRGGGIAVYGPARIVANVIRRNRAGRGAGLFGAGDGLVIEGNTIEDNVGVGDHGGGVFLSGRVTFARNLVYRNEIGRALDYGWGGGVYAHDVGTDVALRGNVYSHNFAPSIGAAFFIDNGAHASSDHELFVENVCPERGGAAIYVDSLDDSGRTGSEITVDHATIVDHACRNQVGGNAVYVEGRGSRATVTNSIAWGNGDDWFHDGVSTLEVRYTLSAEAFAGVGNLSADPRFVANGHRLAPDSPAIDAADPRAPYANEPSPNGNRANLGHDGNTQNATTSR
jgi:hypothetical protein